jgi:hypothetical protein
MAHKQFTVVQDFPQPLSAVFAHMAHHDNLAVLFGVPVRRIRESPDPAEPNGLGSVRVVAIGPVKIEETITVFKKRRRNTYRRKIGHRQAESHIKITAIGGKSDN